ncbi:hypothetical protein COV20_05465 [Candidatus Woesearchaeota archaeon CG10_big_fil_rev_8_21_14_0_10_45_16]|nr:MAG: hypothetical protein COV20_05465 [Candidatus Woesearchaeota archaeon CG10_big_fil_rev_8_21_14_0_10_45_16]
MIFLDGSHGEGGGALIRTALAFSALTGLTFEVDNIRAGRPQPGLKAQHLAAIKALEQICNGKTNEVNIGSEKLRFVPGKVKRGIYEIEIGTAGSISLVLQAIIPPCLFAPGKITLKISGGTCGKWQASVDYISNILFPQLRRFVEKIELKVLKRGYYPKGNGLVEVEIVPRYHSFAEFIEKRHDLRLYDLKQQGTLEHIKGFINLSKELEEKEVGRRINDSIKPYLKDHDVPITIDVEYADSLSTGGEVLLWAIFSRDGQADYENPLILGSDVLIEKGKRSEDIAKEAADKLKEEISSGAVVDHFLADQLIPYLALLPGSVMKTGKVSDHALTNIHVVERFLPVKFEVEKGVVTVRLV